MVHPNGRDVKCAYGDNEGNRTLRYADADASGTLTSGDTDITSYAWDHRNRLASVSHYATYADYQAGATDSTVEYTYDYLDRRILRKIDADGSGAVAADFYYNVYQGAEAALEIHDQNGLANSGTGENAPHRQHRYLHAQAVDQVLASEDAVGDILWGLADHEGTIRDIMNNSGTAVDHRQFDSFGKMTSESAPATDFVFGYAGRPWDAAAGLYDNRARWYDPAAGRFASEDPSGFSAGDANLYRYTANNPLTRTDPTGLQSWGGFGGISGDLGGFDALASQQVFRDAAELSSASISPSPLDFLFDQGPSSSLDSAPAWSGSLEHRSDSFGNQYIAELNAQGQTVGLYDQLMNRGYLDMDKSGDTTFLVSGLEHPNMDEPSSLAIWGGLIAMFAGGPALGALAEWSPAVATTLEVGGAATALASGYAAEEYGRATYYSIQAGDTGGAFENGVNAGMYTVGAGLTGYGTARSAWGSMFGSEATAIEGELAPGSVGVSTGVVDTGFYPEVPGTGVVDTGFYPQVPGTGILDTGYFPAQVTINRQLGLTFQQQVMGALGAQPAGAMVGTTLKGTPYTTIADGILPSGGLLEVKSGQNVSFSPQLQAQVNIGQTQIGVPSTLVVQPTSRVYQPVIDYYNASGGAVLRYDPATGTFTWVR